MPELFTVSIIATDHEAGNPSGKLADAELRFTDAAGPLAGLKLIGFAVWKRRQTGDPTRIAAPGLNVTFPARSYSVNGERRSFALLRPIVDTSAQEPIRAAILAAYELQTDAPDLIIATPETDPPGVRGNYGPVSPRRRIDDDDAPDTEF